MTLFPERKDAVKLLYQAAGRLIDNAAEFDSSISRELNRNRARECVELAEKIGKMGPITIHVNSGVVTDVQGVPFALGNVVKDHDQENVGEKVDSDAELEARRDAEIEAKDD